jgi:TRAF3-interacting protein 1
MNTEKTIKILSSFVSKTPLKDKLLSKPPFRYLHDLIMEIIQSTGYAKDLYSVFEQNSENVKDKDSKIAWLQKIIDWVAKSTGKEIKAKPSKIVAGMDPELTNEFLVLLGKAVLAATK